MQVEIRAKNMRLGTPVRAFVEDCLESALSRFRRRIQRADVLITDENGPRGGVDKLCQIRLDLPRIGETFVEVQDETVERAVTKAALRAARRVRDAVARRRTRARRVSAGEILSERSGS